MTLEDGEPQLGRLLRPGGLHNTSYSSTGYLPAPRQEAVWQLHNSPVATSLTQVVGYLEASLLSTGCVPISGQ